MSNETVGCNSKDPDHDKHNWPEYTHNEGGGDMNCTKCGSLENSVSYIPKGKLINSSSFKKIDNDFIQSSEYDFFFQLTARKEHTAFKCDDCGYSWREECSGMASETVIPVSELNQEVKRDS